APGVQVEDKPRAGAVYLFWGRKGEFPSLLNPVTSADVVLNGNSEYEYISGPLTMRGDINGDGLQDIVVGSNYVANAYVFFGRKSWNSSYIVQEDRDVYFSMEYMSENNIGTGDVNGDGIDDLLIGAYLFYGRREWPDSLAPIKSDVTFIGGGAYAVSCSGDVNGDGFRDVLLGSPNKKIDGISRGEAYIVYGSNNLAETIDLTSQSDVYFTSTELPGSNIGYAVANGADLNGDGLKDVVVTSPGSSGTAPYCGAAYIAFGSAQIPSLINLYTKAQVTIFGSYDSEFIGKAISSDGDVNGDGIDDLIIGAQGKAYCMFGRTDWPPVLEMVAEADSVLDEYGTFGESVCNGGDVNGDGIADIIVGDSFGGTMSGAAYVVFGSPLPLNLTVEKNIQRSDNNRIFQKGQKLRLDYAINPTYGTPPFDTGRRLEAVLGVQFNPSGDEPLEGGPIYVYKPGLTKLVPLPDDWRKIKPTFDNIAFPPMRNPYSGTITFTVPGNANAYCFVGVIYDPATGKFPAGVVRSNRFQIQQ
ncbi:MAG: FG-GAP-like repeat-containing protein, partial [bacterium]